MHLNDAGSPRGAHYSLTLLNGGKGPLLQGEHVMPTALPAMEEAERLEQDIRQRPNGARVQRLLRELFVTQGLLGQSLPRASGLPLRSFAMAAVVAVPALAAMWLPSAQSARVNPLAQPVRVSEVVEPSALGAQQAQASVGGRQEAHARTAVQGQVMSVREPF